MALYNFLELTLFRSYTELKAETKRSYAGFLWWIINPLLYLAVYGIVFGVIFKNSEKHFLLFLFTGIIVWGWFSGATLRGATSIISNKPLMLLVKLNPAMFPIAICIIDMIKFLLGLFVLLLATIFLGDGISWSILYLPFIIITQLVLCIGCSLIVASVTPFVPDLSLILITLMQLLMFLSGVMYSITRLPAVVHPYISLNPMALLIEQYRRVILYHQIPDFGDVVYIWIFGIVAIIVGLLLIKKFSNIYLKRW